MVIVMAGDARIDNAKYKARFAKKAKMPTPDEVLTLIGHPVGGVCPFAVPENVNVYLDVSLRRFETVYPPAAAEQRHRPDAAGAGAVFRLLGVGGCLPRLGRAGGGVTENRFSAARSLSKSPLDFFAKLPSELQNRILQYYFEFCRCGGLWNAKGHPDGFLSHFSSLRNFRLSMFLTACSAARSSARRRFPA